MKTTFIFNKVWRQIKESWVIQLLFVAALIFVILTRFIIHSNREPFANAYKIYWIIYTLDIAYISSYIFYLLNVFTPEYVKRNKVLPYIASNVQYLIGRCKQVLGYMANETGREVKDNRFTLDMIKEIAAKINPNDDSPVADFNLKHWSWKDYVFEINRNDINLYINNLLGRISYLDPVLVELISELQNGLFMLTTRDMKYMNIKNTDFMSWADGFYELSLIANDLEKHFDNNLKPYYQQIGERIKK